MVFAQDRGPRDRGNRQERNEFPNWNNRQRELKPVTIDGTLQLKDGFVAVESGDSVYYVPLLTRYIGFIEGLKEGANVSVEGRLFRNFIQPTKITLNNKSYDFPSLNRAPGFSDQRPGFRSNNWSNRNNFMPGCGNCDNFGPGSRNMPRRR